VLERIRVEADFVEGHWLGLEREGVHEVGDARPRRILDYDAVARMEPALEGALDAIQRAAGDRDLAGDSVLGEIGPRELDQALELRRLAVQPVAGVEAPEGGVERREQRRVRVPAREVARVRRERPSRPGQEGGAVGHHGAAPPVRLHEPALPERSVGGGHGGRAHGQVVGEVADRRQLRPRSQLAACDLGLDRRRDR
jgi:hypothetical protein